MLIDDVAADFPGMPIILAHPSFPWQDEALAVATHKPGVHIDLSGWSPKYFPPQLVQYANSLLQDKVMFGSDYPMLTPDRWLADFEGLAIKPAVREKILKQRGQAAGAVRRLRGAGSAQPGCRVVDLPPGPQDPGRGGDRACGPHVKLPGLHERVSRLARALRGLGAGPGNRVAYLGPNHPAFLETMFAAWDTGAVFVPLNMRLAGPELAYQLADCGEWMLVYAPEQAVVVAGIRGEAGRLGWGTGLRHLVALAGPGAGEHDYESLLAGAARRSWRTCRSAWTTPA